MQYNKADLHQAAKEMQQPQPKDESKEDEFIELDVPIKTPLWEDDESKEVKEGFTGGEWEAVETGGIIDAFEIKSSNGKLIAIARWGTRSTVPETFEEVKANAVLMAQAKNMYFGIKTFLKKLNDFPPTGMSTEEISLLAAIDVIAEDIFLPILEKANPQS